MLFVGDRFFTYDYFFCLVLKTLRMLSAMHSIRRVHVFVFYTVLQKVASTNNGLVFYNTCTSFTMINNTNFPFMHLLSVMDQFLLTECRQAFQVFET